MGSGKQAYLPQTNRSRFIISKERLEKKYLQGRAETVATACNSNNTTALLGIMHPSCSNYGNSWHYGNSPDPKSALNLLSAYLTKNMHTFKVRWPGRSRNKVVDIEHCVVNMSTALSSQSANLSDVLTRLWIKSDPIIRCHRQVVHCSFCGEEHNVRSCPRKQVMHSSCLSSEDHLLSSIFLN